MESQTRQRKNAGKSNKLKNKPCQVKQGEEHTLEGQTRWKTNAGRSEQGAERTTFAGQIRLRTKLGRSNKVKNKH